MRLREMRADGEHYYGRCKACGSRHTILDTDLPFSIPIEHWLQGWDGKDGVD